MDAPGETERDAAGEDGAIRLLVAAGASLQAESLTLALASYCGLTAAWAEPSTAARVAADGACEVIVLVSQPLLDDRAAWTAAAELASALDDLDSSIPIGVVAPTDAPEAIRLTLEAGARGFVSQSQPLADVRAAVATLAAGGTYLRGDHAINVARLKRDAADRLSDREIGVLRLLALGATNKEAAARLHLSERTVESHRASLRHKRNLTDQSTVVAEAIALGLIA